VTNTEKDYQEAADWAEKDINVKPASPLRCAERPLPRSAAICSSGRVGDDRRSTRRRDRVNTPRCGRFACPP